MEENQTAERGPEALQEDITEMILMKYPEATSILFVSLTPDNEESGFFYDGYRSSMAFVAKILNGEVIAINYEKGVTDGL